MSVPIPMYLLTYYLYSYQYAKSNNHKNISWSERHEMYILLPLFSIWFDMETIIQIILSVCVSNPHLNFLAKHLL